MENFAGAQEVVRGFFGGVKGVKSSNQIRLGKENINKKLIFIVALSGAGAFFGYLSSLKGLAEPVSWWLLGGAAVCLLVGILAKASDMEGDYEKETSKTMAYLGLAATCLSTASFAALWLQPQRVEELKFATAIIFGVLSIVEALYCFDEVFAARKKL